MKLLHLFLFPLLLSSTSFAGSLPTYECVGDKFDFLLQEKESAEGLVGTIISYQQSLLRVKMEEGALAESDRQEIQTAFVGKNSREKLTLYIFKAMQGKANLSYLNIERNLGSSSTYRLFCKKIK